ncbi:ABC transporter permease [Streptococcus cuniculipharyngis]|uniref:FtsX-like permease family protein n=1 Tax=Streptococcus cuniculipharyngis TaxID=1562651 RepID=A0A5C5S8Z6_9STRE|nr:FtsX-like permease family protein [Streptococcus cuniculipharyngis]TWS96274.1 FtsX-like permease family protein [Streptococcus cuniculipharyngis]
MVSSLKKSTVEKNKLSLAYTLKLAWGNFLERKWRNLLIALATSIGFIGILISFGLGNAIIKMINEETGNGQLPAQVQVMLNPEVNQAGVINAEDKAFIEKTVGKQKIKYLEMPFSTMISQLSIGKGQLDLSTSLPNYAQLVSLYEDSSISVAANSKDSLLAGQLYQEANEEGVTIPETLLTDFNQANQSNLTAKEVLGKEISLTIQETTSQGNKTAQVTTKIVRVIKDERGDSNSFMAPKQLTQLLESQGFTKTVPYMILELKDPAQTDQVIEQLSRYKKYSLVSQKQILGIIVNFIKVIQGLLIVLSGQALLVSIVMIGVIIYINIMQRSKEIGVMKAVGYLNRDIKGIFVYESLLITFISLLISFLVASLIGAIANQVVQEFYPSIKQVFLLNIQSILVMLVLAFLMGLLSAYFPTLKISKLDPVESLRYE